MEIHSARRSRVVRVAAALGIVYALASCATTQESGGGSFGGAAPAPSPTPPAAAAHNRAVYYASVDGMKVYAEPSTSSKLVTTLALHEKVIRSKLEHGYALVESAKSGMQGWVDNAQLIWRLPTAPTTAAAAEEAPQTEEPAAPAAEEPQAPALPEPTPSAAAAFPTAVPMPTARPISPPTPRPVGPSIFNPY
jgi:hypothetical protein